MSRGILFFHRNGLISRLHLSHFPDRIPYFGQSILGQKDDDAEGAGGTLANANRPLPQGLLLLHLSTELQSNFARLLRLVSTVVSRILPGDDDGTTHSISHRDEHAVDPDGPLLGNEGAVDDGVHLVSVGSVQRRRPVLADQSQEAVSLRRIRIGSQSLFRSVRLQVERSDVFLLQASSRQHFAGQRLPLRVRQLRNEDRLSIGQPIRDAAQTAPSPAARQKHRFR